MQHPEKVFYKRKKQTFGNGCPANVVLYRKISIHFCKTSNYGTAPLSGSGVDGALATDPACHIAARSPPRSFFCKCILRSAIDFAEAAELL